MNSNCSMISRWHGYGRCSPIRSARCSVVREAVSKHALSGIRCRGFEMRAGTTHDGDRMTNALMDNDGSWSIGHNIWWGHSNIDKMHEWAGTYASRIKESQQCLQPSPTPHQSSPEEMYNTYITLGHSVEQAQRSMEYIRNMNAENLARWEKREQEKRDPDYIARIHKREAQYVDFLDKVQQKIAKEGGQPRLALQSRHAHDRAGNDEDAGVCR